MLIDLLNRHIKHLLSTYYMQEEVENPNTFKGRPWHFGQKSKSRLVPSVVSAFREVVHVILSQYRVSD